MLVPVDETRRYKQTRASPRGIKVKRRGLFPKKPAVKYRSPEWRKTPLFGKFPNKSAVKSKQIKANGIHPKPAARCLNPESIPKNIAVKYLKQIKAKNIRLNRVRKCLKLKKDVSASPTLKKPAVKCLKPKNILCTNVQKNSTSL